MYSTEYDLIVVGGGHAGSEAAAVAANMGSRVLLVTMNMNAIAQMSCNPAMGGIAKGQILKEVDAMGAYSGIVADRSTIQFRLLNRSKGPAMWSPRSQNDRQRFAITWRRMLEETPNVDLWQDMVTELLVEEERIKGVQTSMGLEFKAKNVLLTNGTFMNGVIHLGEKQFGGGRAGERASTGLTAQLMELGFESGRMKTGTPPRLDGRSIDRSRTEEQKGDEEAGKFSFSDLTKPVEDQLSCYITYTNPSVHEILEEGFDRSPMFNGRIKSVGPRYCPSIEDKIDRFREKEQHQLFIEPEGRETVETYLNGFSTSLPEDVQLKALREIPGLENVKLFRPGYAIEYDYFPPTQIDRTMQTKKIGGLFFAGQINGTTGYEEAACQGVMAGINAHQRAHDLDPFILQRSESYIGVLIDDLITNGTQEPYRMFTSRAEHRILLRQDNADLRLTPKAHALGIVSDERMKAVEKKERNTERIKEHFQTASIEPNNIDETLQGKGSSPLKQKVKLHKVLRRPEISMEDLISVDPKLQTFVGELDGDTHEALRQAEIQMKYESYIKREEETAEKMQRLDEMKIPKDLDYSRISSLSAEGKEKLDSVRPDDLGQASRISGVTKADISVLMIYLEK
ncbi:MAG: tRNA uridine-5-carboxymethylaminomethyl(34) synthesis enzyme MnmG [Flavobacteriales bacterium]